MVTFVSYCSISAAIFAVTISSAYYTSNLYLLEHHTVIEVLFSLSRQILQSIFYVLACMNAALCLLILFGKLMQILFFGKLRVSETKNIFNRSLSYTIFKIIFVGAILEPLDIPQFLIFAIWFATLGFLTVYSLLCRDRFEYLQTTSNIQLSSHIRLLSLLLIIQFSNLAWFSLCLFFFYETGFSTIFLLTFECLTLFLKTTETLIKYALHMYKYNTNWEPRGTLLYYTELITECSILVTTLAHYAHIFFLHGVSLTLNTILFLHMRVVFNNLWEKLAAFTNYRKLSRAMRDKYPSVTPEQLAALDDTCAICRETMETAKLLPCSHIFHENCLRLWLEHHHSCPTCRFQLINTPNNQDNSEPNQEEDLPQLPDAPPRLDWIRRLFRRPARATNVTPEMITAVREVAPHMSEAWVAQDLARTGSPQLTLERIFEEFPAADSVEEQEVIRENPIVSEVTSKQEVPSAQEISELEKNIPKGFAETAKERERLLNERKELMKKKARLAFLQRKPQELCSYLPKTSSEKNSKSEGEENKIEAEEIPSFSPHDSIEIRRKRALVAAERRLREANNR